MEDLTSPMPSTDYAQPAGPQPVADASRLAVLNYAAPPHRTLPRWLTRPLSPGVAASIWVVSSVAFRFADRRIVYPHLAIGIVLCALAKVIGWRAPPLWKVHVLLSLALLALGIELFVAPWRAWGYSFNYWMIYNQTYKGNYDASLRVAWVPILGIVWLVFAIIGARLSERCRPGDTSAPACPSYRSPE